MNTRNFQQAVSWGLAVLVIYFLYRVVGTFLVPLTWAAILTIFFFRLHRRVRTAIRRPNLSAFVSVSAVAVLLVAPVVWLVPAFVGESLSILGSVRPEDFLPKIQEFFETRLANLPLPIGSFEEWIAEASRGSRALLAEQSARFAGNVVVFVFDLVVMLLAMFYLFRDGPKIVDLLRDVAPFGGDHRDSMVREVTELISVTITSGFAVAAAQGIAGGLTFWLLGMPSPIFWGVIVGLLAFLPVVGPWLVWLPAGAGMILSGDTGRGVGLLVLGLVFVSGTDNVLRPILIAGRSQLNGLLVFISILGGINAFGFLGVVLGPLVIATAVGLLKGYRESLRDEHKITPASEAA